LADGSGTRASCRCALIAHGASFLPGMRASLLIAAVTLAVAAAAAFALPRGSARGAARK